MVIKIYVVFWVVTPCSDVSTFWPHSLHPEDVGSMAIQNVINLPHHCMMS